MELSIRPVREGDLEAPEELDILAWGPVFASLRNVLGPAIR
jgi:hypothetical protein